MRSTGIATVLMLYVAAVAVLVISIQSQTDGRLVYPLDDTYIHMAMAKHVASDGVWGVTSEGFTSASSSPLWTASLALVYVVAGAREWAPLLLNVICGAVLLLSAHAVFSRAGLSPLMAAVATAVVLVAGLIPTLTLLGMEHTLHALVTMWFVLLGAAYALSTEQAPAWLLPVLAAVLVLIRFEGAFAVAAVSVALASAKRWRTAVVVAAAAIVAIGLFAAWSVAQGGPVLPNSVLLKGAVPSQSSASLVRVVLFTRALATLASTPHLAVLVIAVLALALLPANHARQSERRLAAVMFTAIVLLHLQFAAVGWFFRYEAYLVVLGLVIIGVLAAGVDWRVIVPQPLSPTAAAAALLLIAAVANPLALRAWHGFRQVPLAASNIFDQQYQLAHFLQANYAGQRVAVNDIGAIAFFADGVKLLDLYGLASDDVRAMKRSGRYTREAVEELAAQSGAQVAVIYPTFLEQYGGVPTGWQKVGEWSVADNVVLGENGFSFFGVDSSASKQLADNLAGYSPRLPARVRQSGAYLASR